MSIGYQMKANEELFQKQCRLELTIHVCGNGEEKKKKIFDQIFFYEKFFTFQKFSYLDLYIFE